MSDEPIRLIEPGTDRLGRAYLKAWFDSSEIAQDRTAVTWDEMEDHVRESHRAAVKALLTELVDIGVYGVGQLVMDTGGGFPGIGVIAGITVNDLGLMYDVSYVEDGTSFVCRVTANRLRALGVQR